MTFDLFDFFDLFCLFYLPFFFQFSLAICLFTDFLTSFSLDLMSESSTTT